MEWYKEYPHIGYDLSGMKILKPKTGDELDNLIEMSENPDYWSVYDIELNVKSLHQRFY